MVLFFGSMVLHFVVAEAVDGIAEYFIGEWLCGVVADLDGCPEEEYFETQAGGVLQVVKEDLGVFDTSFFGIEGDAVALTVACDVVGEIVGIEVEVVGLHSRLVGCGFVEFDDFLFLVCHAPCLLIYPSLVAFFGKVHKSSPKPYLSTGFVDVDEIDVVAQGAAVAFEYLFVHLIEDAPCLLLVGGLCYGGCGCVQATATEDEEAAELPPQSALDGDGGEVDGGVCHSPSRRKSSASSMSSLVVV